MSSPRLFLPMSLALAAACASTPKQPARASASPAASAYLAVTPPAPVVRALDVPAHLELSREGRRAVDVLGAATAFGGAKMGYAAQPSAEVEALRVLLSEPRAADALEIVVDQGTLAGQLMALSALAIASPSRFAARIDAYRDVDAKVLVLHEGCDPRAEAVRTAEVDIAGGAYGRWFAGSS